MLNDAEFTTRELAEYLKVSTRTLERWRKKRCGPRYEKQGRFIRYKLSSIKEWQNAIETL